MLLVVIAVLLLVVVAVLLLVVIAVLLLVVVAGTIVGTAEVIESGLTVDAEHRYFLIRWVIDTEMAVVGQRRRCGVGGVVIGAVDIGFLRRGVDLKAIVEQVQLHQREFAEGLVGIDALVVVAPGVVRKDAQRPLEASVFADRRLVVVRFAIAQAKIAVLILFRIELAGFRRRVVGRQMVGAVGTGLEVMDIDGVRPLVMLVGALDSRQDVGAKVDAVDPCGQCLSVGLTGANHLAGVGAN